jgi:hypothetical protein
MEIFLKMRHIEYFANLNIKQESISKLDKTFEKLLMGTSTREWLRNQILTKMYKLQGNKKNWR